MSEIRSQIICLLSSDFCPLLLQCKALPATRACATCGEANTGAGRRKVGWSSRYNPALWAPAERGPFAQ